MSRRWFVGGVLVVFACVSVGYLGWCSLYDAEDFNCVDRSYTLAPVLYQFGLPAEVVYGSRNGGSHCWVRVWGVPLDSSWWRYEVDFVDRYPWGYWDELQQGD